MYLEVKNVKKSYGENGSYVQVLKGVNTSLDKGQMCVIQGTSGSGKSTLLNCIGGLDGIDSGSVCVAGTLVERLKGEKLSDYRRDNLGFIFQFYNLLPSLTAYENVALTKTIVKNAQDPGKMLEAVGLAKDKHKFPSQMSGGEQQRVSIARALAKNPSVILGDEPTGALDSETGVIVLELLQKMCREEHKTVILVTHNADIARCADKIIRMKNGKVREIKINDNPVPVREVEW
jgi:putative ABC transport system ATP-binding protein